MVKANKMETPSKKCVSFFKVYIPAHSSERLCIPAAFMAHLNGVLPDKTILRSRLGRLWHVEVATIKDDMFFQKGWQRFVKDNNVELGDFLVFQYNGHYVFDFKILGKSGCEKDETWAHVNIDKRTLYIKEEEKGEEEDKEEKGQKEELEEKTLNMQTLRSKGSSAVKVKEDNHFEAESSTQIKPGRMNKLAQVPTVQDTGLQFCGTELKNFTNTADERNERIESDELELPVQHEDVVEVIDVETRSRACSALRRPVTAESRQRAIDAARMFKPENPSIEVILRPSYVQKGNMHVPSDFAEKYLSGVVNFIKLQVSDGRQWQVRCIHREGMVNKLSKGWSAFVLDNGLEEGDVCVFERIKSKGVVLKVSIFRVVES